MHRSNPLPTKQRTLALPQTFQVHGLFIMDIEYLCPPVHIWKASPNGKDQPYQVLVQMWNALLQCGWEGKKCCHLGRQLGSFSKCSTYTNPMSQPFYEHAPVFTKNHILEHAEQDSLKRPWTWGSSKVPSAGEWDKWGLYTRGHMWDRQTCATHNMEEPHTWCRAGQGAGRAVWFLWHGGWELARTLQLEGKDGGFLGCMLGRGPRRTFGELVRYWSSVWVLVMWMCALGENPVNCVCLIYTLFCVCYASIK